MMYLYQDLSPSIKRYVRLAAVVFFTGLAVSSFAVTFSYMASGRQSLHEMKGIRQISISGEGKVAAKPDIAKFTVGILTRAKKVGEAQRDDTDRSNRVLGFLKKQGVAEKDIKTIGYTIYPQYQYQTYPSCILDSCPPHRPPEIASYEVRHTIEVKIRNLEIVDDLLQGVVEQGANEVGSISFSIENEDALKAEARKKAIDDAKAKARMLARDLGVRLKRIVSFSESGNGAPPIYSVIAEYMKVKERAAPGPQVEPGEQEIQSQVTITYEFR